MNDVQERRLAALSVSQRRGVWALVNCATRIEAAQRVGVTTRTLNKWMLRPDFSNAYHAAIKLKVSCADVQPAAHALKTDKGEAAVLALLSPRHQRAVHIMLDSKTRIEAAQRVGVTTRTLNQWMLLDVFREAYSAAEEGQARRQRAEESKPSAQQARTRLEDSIIRDLFVEHSTSKRDLEFLLGMKWAAITKRAKLMGLTRKPMSAPGHARYNAYCSAASKRGYVMHLTLDQFGAMIVEPCAYCGTVDAGGIDRINSRFCYTVENTCACCARCNTLKLTYTRKSFIAHAQAIVSHQNKLKGRE